MSDELPEINFDSENLYREEVYTDQKVGSIRVMSPVTATGEVDSKRKTMFVGQTQIMTPAGALPLNFELEADDLASAIEQFGDGAQQAMEKTMEELREMRRQQASSIVVPGQEDLGSKIQLP